MHDGAVCEGVWGRRSCPSGPVAGRALDMGRYWGMLGEIGNMLPKCHNILPIFAEIGNRSIRITICSALNTQAFRFLHFGMKFGNIVL